MSKQLPEHGQERMAAALKMSDDPIWCLSLISVDQELLGKFQEFMANYNDANILTPPELADNHRMASDFISSMEDAITDLIIKKNRNEKIKELQGEF